jgi:hypothetical protein
LKKVSKLLGHSDITITEQVYSHLLDGDLRIRDEFHFDNQTEATNSVRKDSSDELLRGLLTQALNELLRTDKTPEERAQQLSRLPTQGTHPSTTMNTSPLKALKTKKAGMLSHTRLFVFRI